MNDVAPTGHVKLARKAFDADHGDSFWLEPREFSRWEAWVDVIQLAAYRAHRQTTTHFGVVDLLRGEFVASLRWLAARWHWTIKRVRYWIATCEKGARLKAQRETQAGTVYLVVNYDAYQSQGHSKGTAEEPAKGTAGAQQGHKTEAVKAVKAVKAPSEPTRTAGVIADSTTSRFPKATCDAAYNRWAETIGAMNYGAFRKALQPVFDAQPGVYSGEQLVLAVDAFHEAMQGDDVKWRDKWTERKFAREIHHWVKLGAMELVDEWGAPTERGRALNLFPGA